MMGGPLGALLGIALGGYFDRGLNSTAVDDASVFGATERLQSVFFTSVFTLMGYLAKSDGRVTADEITLAEQLMQQMRLSPKQRQVAINLFHQGKQDDFPVDQVLRQFRRECGRRRNLLQMFLEIQIATAFADGKLHDQEQGILERIARELGYTHQQFNELLTRMTGQAHFVEQLSIQDKLQAAYELLGVDATADDATVKKAWRRQMNQHHPDKLVAKGLPEEMIELATRKTQDIRDAYDLIRSQRK